MASRYKGVPFKADSSNGLSEANGIAKFSEAGIVIEFESKFLGFIGGSVHEVRLSLDDILDIQFKKGIFRFFAKIKLRVKNMEKLQKLPNESGKVTLKIKREDFHLAESAVKAMQGWLGLTPQPTVIDENPPPSHLPPAQTSVNELFDTEKLESEESKETNKLNE